MSIWRIDIYGNKNVQDTVCCTVLVRSDSVKLAELLAEEENIKNYPFLGEIPRAKSCGLASDIEAQQLEENEKVTLINYKLNHV